MNEFWTIAGAMLIAAVIMLAPALLLSRRKTFHDRQQQNVRIARERLHELKVQHENGALTTELYEQTRRELEQSLLADVETDNNANKEEKPVNHLGKGTLGTLLVVLPIAAVALYMKLGDPEAIQKSAAHQLAQADSHEANKTNISMEDAANMLASKLEQKPGDGEGWFLLGQTYMALGQHVKAAQAFARSYKLLGEQPQVMLRYADALAMAQGGRMTGEPFELVKKVLVIKPQDMTGLWLGGIGYAEQGDFKQAVLHWRRLESMLSDDPKSLAEVRNMIVHAEQQLGMKVEPQTQTAQTAPASASDVAITVEVSLDSALRQQAKPDDIVFIFARALSGPPMPLAVARKRVKDLPLTVTLNDAMAMMPQMKLSNFPEVQVSARVSKSGKPIAQSGDLQGASIKVNTRSKDRIKIEINQKLP